MPVKRNARPLLAVGAVCWLFSAQAANQLPEQEEPPADLTDMSMKDLLELDLRSVMKTTSGTQHAAAAVFVLDADDIRRSGATLLPEALRLVPGMNVARIDGNKWAVSMRGFNNQFSNKLLVLKDGRSLYSPTFSGTWWDQEDVLLEDIERIEVIRGPGASLWGANAVNGVINLISKKLPDSQGGLVSAHGGSLRKGGGLRYGMDLGHHQYAKIFGRYVENDASKLADTQADAGDNRRLAKLGFQYDKNLAQDKLSLQGEVFSGWSGGADQISPNLAQPGIPVSQPPYLTNLSTNLGLSGHYVMGRWQHQHSPNASSIFRTYWNHNERKSSEIGAVYEIDTVDTDFQNNFRGSKHHSFLWGVGARLNFNHTDNSQYLGWIPSKRQDEIVSLFVQDDISLIPNLWQLTLGNKLEHNPVTHTEWQPNARLAFTPSAKQTWWASISRAVRTPSWAEQNIFYHPTVIPPMGGGAASPFNPVILVNALGNPKQTSEKLLAYELGWRGGLSPNLSGDLTFYYYDYEKLLTLYPGLLNFSTIDSGYLLQTVQFSNQGTGRIVGGEAALDWHVHERWQLRASYSHANQNFASPGSGPATVFYAASSPTHQAMLWSMHQLTPALNLDLNWRFVGSISTDTWRVPDYQELDARLAWRVNKQLELSLVGRNLLHDHHPEFCDVFYSIATQVNREVYANIRLDF